MTRRAVLWAIGIMGVPAIVIMLLVYAFAGDNDRDSASVIRVIDGDTIDVLLEGEETRVRLLNIDTPETKHPNESVECLGPEAGQFLKDLLPAGTEIELEYDTERHDRYGRTLAGVFHEESLVNADIAAKGYGVAMMYEPNRKFYDAVKRAEQEARNSARGLFDSETGCALPQQLEQLQSRVDQLPEELPVDIAGVQGALEALEPLLASASSYSEIIVQMRSDDAGDKEEVRFLAGAYADQITVFEEQVESNHEVLRAYESELTGHKEALEDEAEREREEEERKQAEEEQRNAEEEQQREEAEEQRQREAEAAAEQQRQQELQPEHPQQVQPDPQPQPQQSHSRDSQQPAESSGSQSSGSPRSSGSGSSNSSGNGPPAGYGTDADYPGYTGPRCYAPGGRYWQPC